MSDQEKLQQAEREERQAWCDCCNAYHEWQEAKKKYQQKAARRRAIQNEWQIYSEEARHVA